MPPIQLKEDGTPVKIFLLGDLVTPSGFGRIINSISHRMTGRGWVFFGASLQWPGYPFAALPFPVMPLAGKEPNALWGSIQGLIQAENPDVVIVAQDFPYSTTTFHSLKIDWSQHKFICITPIDGTPIAQQWLDLVDLVDATMVISKFGVEAMRQEGRQVDLLHPGVDANEFYPAEEGEVKALRARAGIPETAFVTGSFMMNQGRKAVSKTIEMFGEFAKDKPDAWLLMDMDKGSPAGWDIPATMKQLRFPDDIIKRVIYREDLLKPEIGLVGLRERYLLCDVTSQIAHREGFGLPNLESMACKVPPMVLDWCSGTELASGGKAILVKRLPYMEIGTWGGARDAFPDEKDWMAKWNAVYKDRDLLAEHANKGYRWAKRQTWDKATDAFEEVLKRVVNQQKKERTQNGNQQAASITPGLNDDGNGRGNAPIPPPPTENIIHNHPDIQLPAYRVEMPEQSNPNDNGDCATC